LAGAGALRGARDLGVLASAASAALPPSAAFIDATRVASKPWPRMCSSSGSKSVSRETMMKRAPLPPGRACAATSSPR